MRALVEMCDAVAATTKKSEKVRLVSEYFKAASVDDAARAAIFLSGRPFASREERVLNIGGRNLARLVAELAGAEGQDLGSAYREHGDLGDMAGKLLREQNAMGDIDLQEVEAVFHRLPSLRSQPERLAGLKSILEKASAPDVKYIIKIITGDLRIGLKESLVEEAIAKAFARPLESVRRANMLTGDLAETLRAARNGELTAVAMRLFHPIGFMLAAAVEEAADIKVDASAEMYVEKKYDGIRAQVHKSKDGVKMFSRTLDEIVEFPELIAPIAAMPGEMILDGEILGWLDDRPLPFTELQKRLGRKQMNLWLQKEIPVRFMAFDLLYHDGELLLDAPLADRRKRLEWIFSGRHADEIQAAPAERCDSSEKIESTFRTALAAGYEGIVAKSPSSPYVPGRRGGFWFKLKEAFATLDVVVTAVEYGHGKRHAVLSDYTFAVRDGQRLLNIGKAYSGLTDAEIRQYTGYFLEHTVQDQGFRRTVEQNVVIEVAFNNIQRSKRHESGFALRFPRIVRLRPDKTAGQIDTIERVEELFAKQGALGRSAVDDSR
ncbi:MAG TPA: ATP-dependent DNA ligase [Candidatus Acidoferrales bacterium]|nr:ATP-dependent DNA ligase [Candidatus Acidoferrales bacterium]